MVRFLEDIKKERIKSFLDFREVIMREEVRDYGNDEVIKGWIR